jgi:hypothetical protein
MELIECVEQNPLIHLVLYVNKQGDEDSTFREFKADIEALVPVVVVREVNLVEVLKEIVRYKGLYNDVLDEHLEDLITDEQRDHMFEILCISDFDRPSLSTVVIMPDAANSVLFYKRERNAAVRNYFTDFVMRERRHRDVGITMMFCCQNVKDIPTDIRGNADAWFLFAGYPPHDISLIRQYLPTRMDKDEL